VTTALIAGITTRHRSARALFLDRLDEAFDTLSGDALLEIDLLPELVAVGRVRGHRCDRFFLDIGLPETYEEAQRGVLAWWAG
tara:strand:+ start:110 stop:358 length:249 start_codon:yes stop_codon:yes gene_type:complete